MASLTLGNSTKLTVVFRDWSDGSETGSIVDPVSIAGNILNEAGVTVGTFAPTRLSLGTFQYIWTPNTLGTFTVEFVGTFADGVDTVAEEFDVFAAGQSVPITQQLGEDQNLVFMPELDPMFLDTEEIQAVYPDATSVEVAELVHYYSLQAQAILTPPGAPPVTKMSFTAYEYIKASTLCSLSKVYDLADSEMSVTLGDLSVTTQRFSKIQLGRANATTWCELAAVLRRELMNTAGKTGILGVVRGSHLCNPIPQRRLRSKEIPIEPNRRHGG